MRLRAVSLDDEEMPETLTVEMTVDEAAMIYAFVGHIFPKAVNDAAGGDARWGHALMEVANCLARSFFNRFWEDGPSEVVPQINPRVGTDQ